MRRDPLRVAFEQARLALLFIVMVPVMAVLGIAQRIRNPKGNRP